MALLQAELQPLELDLQRTAVVVVDMQNAFVSQGGMFDRLGHDVSGGQRIVAVIRRINSAARAGGIKVIYVAHRHSPDLREIGPESPYWQKADVVHHRKHPEWRDALLIRGTWGAEIVEELTPAQGDLLVEKPRYSAFAGTDLDLMLKTYGIKYLAFVGVATNICVQSSVRDAFHLDYFAILVSDATATPSPPPVQEAVENDVKACFGWVTSSQNLITIME